MKLTAIVAAAENGVIGKGGQMPWHLPADLKHFKLRTMGRPVVMGRKTWEAIGKPLPGRLNVVLTKQADWSAEGAVVAHSLDEALSLPEVAGAEEVMIIGGAQLFAEALPRCDELELTRVHAEVEGDAFFTFDESAWQLDASEGMTPDDKHPWAFTFETWIRRR
ncbi:dihydrofolate reductase [Vulgatibacter sp.]|uniref:dihydrofolate reductase n=1 Tax=Vulgatibacter sp. TaxID=1971226 RepID=UPI0035622413